VRLAMLGDWGTGLYGAPTCAKSIAGAKPAYDILLHLGDVYYAGTEPEVEGRFLNLWPNIPNAISCAINSNHEMYSGGNAYFRQTLPAFRQSSSVFALRNDCWLLIGLDSAYEGNDRVGGKLSDLQAGWVAAQVDEAAKNGQRVILFSHHQPFSLFETQGAILADCLKGALAARKIFAWYWGHEHRCVIYERHPDWNLYGRCIGHSGYPYFRDIFPGALKPQTNPDGSKWITLIARKSAPTGTVLDGPNPYIVGHQNQYGPNGYLTLEFSGRQINETVHAADGTPLYDHQLV
jgi:Calcineurin-like phosphoesterase